MAQLVSRLSVTGMSCGHCVKSIQKAVGGLPGVNNVTVDLGAAMVTINYDDQAVNLPAIKEAITEQGYEVQ